MAASGPKYIPYNYMDFLRSESWGYLGGAGSHCFLFQSFRAQGEPRLRAGHRLQILDPYPKQSK